MGKKLKKLNSYLLHEWSLVSITMSYSFSFRVNKLVCIVKKWSIVKLNGKDDILTGSELSDTILNYYSEKLCVLMQFQLCFPATSLIYLQCKITRLLWRKIHHHHQALIPNELGSAVWIFLFIPLVWSGAILSVKWSAFTSFLPVCI